MKNISWCIALLEILITSFVTLPEVVTGAGKNLIAVSDTSNLCVCRSMLVFLKLKLLVSDKEPNKLPRYRYCSPSTVTQSYKQLIINRQNAFSFQGFSHLTNFATLHEKRSTINFNSQLIKNIPSGE